MRTVVVRRCSDESRRKQGCSEREKTFYRRIGDLVTLSGTDATGEKLVAEIVSIQIPSESVVIALEDQTTTGR